MTAAWKKVNLMLLSQRSAVCAALLGAQNLARPRAYSGVRLWGTNYRSSSHPMTSGGGLASQRRVLSAFYGMAKVCNELLQIFNRSCLCCKDLQDMIQTTNVQQNEELIASSSAVRGEASFPKLPHALLKVPIHLGIGFRQTACIRLGIHQETSDVSLKKLLPPRCPCFHEL